MLTSSIAHPTVMTLGPADSLYYPGHERTLDLWCIFNDVPHILISSARYLAGNSIRFLSQDGTEVSEATAGFAMLEIGTWYFCSFFWTNRNGCWFVSFAKSSSPHENLQVQCHHPQTYTVRRMSLANKNTCASLETFPTLQFRRSQRSVLL